MNKTFSGFANKSLRRLKLHRLFFHVNQHICYAKDEQTEDLKGFDAS